VAALCLATAFGCVPPGPPPSPRRPPLHVPALGWRDWNVLQRESLPPQLLTPALVAASGCYALQWPRERCPLWPDTVQLELARSPLDAGAPEARVSVPGPSRAAFDSTSGRQFYWEADSAEVRIVRLRIEEGPDYLGIIESSRLVGAPNAEGFDGHVTVTWVGPGPLARSWPVVGRRVPCSPSN